MNPQATQGVVIQQPMVGQTVIQVNAADPKQPRGIPRDWSTDLFGCFDDMGVCLLQSCIPFIHDCMISSDMGEGFCMPCCVPVPVLVMRAHIRGKHNIQGSLMNDCCAITFCGPCAACQLAREVKMINTGMAQP